ncbi:MAG: hypothetical protein ACR2OI_07965, partial [Acidimicrobiia bacterium]
VWLFIAFAARGTLPIELQELYNVTWDGKRQRLLDVNLAVLRRARPFLPDRLRTVRPAAWAQRRLAGEHVDLIEKARQARRSM